MLIVTRTVVLHSLAVILTITLVNVAAAQIAPLFSSTGELRTKAAELQHANRTTSTPPRFSVTGNTLSFYFGKVFVKAGPDAPWARDPGRIPLEAQLHLNMLRTYLPYHLKTSMRLWNPYLKHIESVIDAMLNDIKDTADPDLLTKMLSGRQAEIASTLEQAVAHYAAARHLQLVYSPEFRGKKITVTFVSHPPGAEIKIVMALVFKGTSGSLDDSLWIDVSGGNKIDLLAGDWQVKRRWSKNAEWSFGRESLTRDGKFIVKQTP